MEKVVLACEGKSEVELLIQLMENGCLVFNDNEILDKRPIHLRQPHTIAPIINTLPIDTKITFYRIGDTQKDAFDLSCFGNIRINNIQIIKVCTTPELEILIIINEGLYEEYLKQKSKIMPKQFVKMYVSDYSSFGEYIRKKNIVPAIKEYKRLKKKKHDEMYLADIIK